jgi:hypothetical protein
MKTIAIILLVAMASFRMTASEPEPRFPDNILKHVNSVKAYPQTALKSNVEGYVDLVFAVNEEGRITVIEYFGTDPLLSEYVLKSLSEIRMCPFDLSVGMKYKIRYSFNLL